jgi:hypothetical protein
MAKPETTGTAPAPDARDDAFAYQLDFLKLEFEHVTEAIGRIDDTTAKVKNWAIVTWVGSVGLVLGQPQFHPILWFTGVVPLLFFFVDAWWRSIQRSFIFRVQVISTFLNGDHLRESFRHRQLKGFVVLDPRAQQMAKSPEYRAFTSVFRTLRFKEVAAFYLGLSLVSFVLWGLLNFAFHIKTLPTHK